MAHYILVLFASSECVAAGTRTYLVHLDV